MSEIYVLFLKQTLCNHYKLYLSQKKLKQTHKLVNTNYYVTLTQSHTVWNTALTTEKIKPNITKDKYQYKYFCEWSKH